MLSVYLTFSALWFSSALEVSAESTRNETFKLSPCEKFYSELKESNKDIAIIGTPESNFFLFSGLATGDLGDYPACSQYPNASTYVLVTHTINNTFLGYQGICGPKVCSMDDYVNIGSFFNVFLEKVETTFTQGNVSFSFPEGYEFDITAGAIIFMIIAFIIVSKGILSGIVTRPLKVEEATESKPKAKGSDTLIDPSEGGLSLIQSDSFLWHTSPTKYILRCFNVVENLKETFKKNLPWNHNEKLDVFAGLKVISFLWILMGQITTMMLYGKDPSSIPNFIDSFWYLFVIGSSYGITIFFFMSGFMSVYLVISQLEEMDFTFKNLLRLIFHRFIKYWPLYTLATLFFWNILPLIETGPLWGMIVTPIIQNCSSTWWESLLLAGNFFGNSESSCYSWAWFISADFQLYFVSLILGLIYTKKPALSYLLGVCAILFSITYNFKLGLTLDVTFSLDSTITNPQLFMNTLSNIAPYSIGLIFGLAFIGYRRGNLKNYFSNIEDTSELSHFVGIFGFLIINALIFVPSTLQAGSWSKKFSDCWQAVGPTVYALGLGLFITPLIIGTWFKISQFLSANCFKVISKMLLSSYLNAYLVLSAYFYSITTLPNITAWALIEYTILASIVVLIVGLAARTLIQKPFTNIDSRIINRKIYRELTSSLIEDVEVPI